MNLRVLVAVVVVAVLCACPGPSTNDGGVGGGGGFFGGGTGGGTTGGGTTGGGTTGGGTTGGGTTGGGTTGGGTTGGGTTGGGATGGGTGGATGDGAFFHDVGGSQSPDVRTDSTGRFHAVWDTGASGRSVEYATCLGACGSESAWTFATLYRQQSQGSVSDARFAVGANGQLHVVYGRFLNSVAETIYLTCASNCASPTSWQEANLTSLFTAQILAPFRGAPIVVDDSGRVSFVVSDGYPTLATCGSNCLNVASWSKGTFRNTAVRTQLAARGTTLHMVFHDGTVLRYASCASNCTAEASWSQSAIGFVHDGAQPTNIAVGADGRVSIAYNQGTTSPSQSPQILSQADKVLVWQCAANCNLEASWSGVILGAAGDGQEGMALAEIGGALMLAMSTDSQLSAAICTSNCTTGTQWNLGGLDTAATMAAAIDPYTYFSCSGNRPQIASWSPKDPSVAISPTTGSLVTAHTPVGHVTCGGNTSNAGTVLRFVYTE
ncbi:MAG: hypothetical protein QM817_32310 [Archangium sp.]